MNPQAAEAAREFFAGFLRVLGESGAVEVAPEGEGLYVNLRGGFRYLPPGDAEFRGALGRVARLHLRVRHGQDVPVIVDVNGEVLSHREELAGRARAWAEEALAGRRRVELPPMGPDDRRVVHTALSGIPGIRTFSVGRDPNRRVVIEPAED